MKKLIRGISLLSLCLILGVNVSLQPIQAFTDLDDSRATTMDIKEFETRGLIFGYPDGTFRPEATISRAEFLSLINRTFGFTDATGSIVFTDVPLNAWYMTELKVALQKGYIKGYTDNTFRASKNISRNEAAAIINRILGYSPTKVVNLKDAVQSWARDDVYSLLNHEIMFAEDGFFYGDVPITREDTVVSLLTVLHQQEAALNGTVDASGTTSDTTSGAASSDKPSAEVIYSMEVTIQGLEEVLLQGTSYAKLLGANQLLIVRQIKDNMEKYVADDTYDYETAAAKVNTSYNALTSVEQTNIQNAVSASVPYIYLDIVKQYFENK